MRCAYSSITCPAGDSAPGHRGGDIVAAVETPDAVRLLIGDVMGHGPKAMRIAASVTCAFSRLAAHAEDPAQVVAARLDHLVTHLEVSGETSDGDASPGAAGNGGTGPRETGSGTRHREEFVTALFIDIPRDGSEARIICCGHPPPLVLRDGGATFLDAIPPGPPLGLLDLAGSVFPCPVPLGARPGDTVLLYTDGVTEARDGNGAIYPFPDRAAALARERRDQDPPGQSLAAALAADLLAHVGGALRDDATLMTLLIEVGAPEASADRAGARGAEAGKGPCSIFLAAE